MLRRIALLATCTVGGVAAIVAYHPPSLNPVANGQTISAKALQYPNGDRRSQSIAQQSIPYLI